jgi:hypothetical protein
VGDDEVVVLRRIIATYERDNNEKDIQLLELKNRLKNAEDAVLDTHYREQIPIVSASDVDRLLKKDQEYGASWKRRGGVGAFMMMVRKIDRIMTQIPEPDGHPKHGFDIFAILADEHADLSESLLDTLRDLRGYATLIEAEHLVRMKDRQEKLCHECGRYPCVCGTQKPLSPLVLDEKKFFGDMRDFGVKISESPDLTCPTCGRIWSDLPVLGGKLITKKYPHHIDSANDKLCSVSDTWINPLDDTEPKSNELQDLVCPVCSRKWEKSRRKDGSLIAGHYPQHGDGVSGACGMSGTPIELQRGNDLSDL